MMSFLSVPSSKVIAGGGGFQVKSVRIGLATCRHAGSNSRHTMPDAIIHARGRIVEPLGPVLYRVALPNGKIILAHLSKTLRDEQAGFMADAHVLLELTPYDFDTARISGLG